jgi:anti-sigma factor RsiW
LNCDGVVRSVSSYIDGELELAIRKEFDMHLRGCNGCAIFVQQTKFTVKIFHDADLADLPAEARSRLHQKLRQKIGEFRK